MQKTAVIVAGGTGTRMKANLPKQFLPLRGQPVLIHTLKSFLDFDPELKIVLVLHSSTHSLWEEAAAAFLNDSERQRIRTAAGGAERTESVYNGLLAMQAFAGECLVAIHDAVRPFVTPDMLTEAYATAEAEGASVCCVPVKSSVREITPEGSRAVDRGRFLHVQTPQTFRLLPLLQAYQNRPHNAFTDDASLFEAMGSKVVVCQGSYDNIKLTTPEDLFVAERILNKKA
jgi:2-C-methyl-D-erythritol 4-phosphate cytidylyltransferase